MFPAMRRTVACAVTWAAIAACAPVAHARESPRLVEPRLTDAELARQRGGFTVAGLDIQFGAEISSYLGDQLAMQTNLSWTDAGGNVTTSYSAALTPASADAVRTGLLAGTGVTLSLGTASVLLANQGQTAFIQRGTGTIQNIVVNTASNVKLSQSITGTLDISGYALFQNGVLSSRIGTTLAAMSALANRQN